MCCDTAVTVSHLTHAYWVYFVKPNKVFAALWFKARGAFSNNLDTEDPDVAFCNDMLGKVNQCSAAEGS